MLNPLPQPENKARRGVYAAAISPLNEDGSLNGPRLAAYCQYLLSEAGGCDGVAPLGTAGEGTSLSLADRCAAPGHLAAAGVPGKQVIFGAGAASVGDAVAVGRAAVEAGYTNLLVLPPYYYKSPEDDGLYEAYSRLIEGVGSDALRVYLYHIPQMSAVPLSVELVVRLRKAFGPVVAGIKDSSGDFSQSLAYIEATGGIASDFDVFPASEAMLWDGIDAGAAGIISGSTNAFGAMTQAALQTETGAAREAAMERLRRARDIISGFNMTAAMKQIAAWRNNEPELTRVVPPLLPLSQVERERLKTELEGLS
ncbi:MAG: dihydrodipicolinate synthase family protein [Silicimonas sp.]|nr:dihydrodipicolinate synthase family protein [Silicimonas sp.]